MNEICTDDERSKMTRSIPAADTQSFRDEALSCGSCGRRGSHQNRTGRRGSHQNRT